MTSGCPSRCDPTTEHHSDQAARAGSGLVGLVAELGVEPRSFRGKPPSTTAGTSACTVQ